MKKKCIVRCIYIFAIWALMFSWSTHLNQNQAPDEYMRMDVVRWIVENGKLPIGNEADILDPNWGFSYALIPYFPSILGAIFVKFVSIISSNPVVWLIAARQTSVLAGVGTAYFALRIGDKIFEEEVTKYAFSSMICLLPQFVFLCSYHNNDSFSVFTCLAILYFCICGVKDGWNYKNSICLGISIGMCAITYYYAYAYILLSIIIYIRTNVTGKSFWKNKEFWKYGLLIATIALAVGGWFFIRSALLHNGDFLGLQTTKEYSEMYGIDMCKPSNRVVFADNGSIWDLLANTTWIELTIKSFVGNFGYLTVGVSWRWINLYVLMYLLGLILGLIFLLKKRENRFYVGVIVMTIIVPICISIIYSYSSDYQAQGRYVMSILPGIALLGTKGYEKLGETCNNQKKLMASIIGIFIFLFVMVAHFYIWSQCWCTSWRGILS